VALFCCRPCERSFRSCTLRRECAVVPWRPCTSGRDCHDRDAVQALAWALKMFSDPSCHPQPDDLDEDEQQQQQQHTEELYQVRKKTLRHACKRSQGWNHSLMPPSSRRTIAAHGSSAA
jgi:hypothetical protein